MNIKYVLLRKIKDATLPMTAEEIARRLRLGIKERPALKDMLWSFVRSGELLADSAGRFGTAEQFGAKRGKIAGNERGFGFFVPEDGSGDLFLPRRALKNALHGDDVLCFRRTGDEGEVLAIIERGVHEIVGTFRFERQGGFVTADDKKYTERIFIAKNQTNGCKNGDKVAVKIKSYDDRMPIGEIIEVLGKSGDLFTEEKAIIRSHSLRETFPEDVLREGEKQAKKDPLSALDGRADFRNTLIITIDGEDTRDIDDAISIEKRGKFYHLGVHIADVSHYVKRNGLLDAEAFRRGTSVYFPDRVLPMLPPSLSDNICSLNEGAVRLTLSCLMTVNENGKVIAKKIVPSVIRSRHRMTYTAVTAIADGKKEAVEAYPDLVDFIKTAVELTNILKRSREARGGLDLDINETKILFGDGKISISPQERTISHEMIEQFMILANESVAEIMTEMRTPFVYRVHEKPSEEKAASFRDFLEGIGVGAPYDPRKVTPKDYQKILKSPENAPAGSVLNRVMLRSMMKAFYSPENIGHFGLASDCYCHFTSPIRRYPDLYIHRIIKDSLADRETVRKKYQGETETVSARSSACEKNAMEAERDADALYAVTYMQDKIGEEYEAAVTGVTPFGLFAELENTVEGLIPLEMLPEDRYEFSEDRLLLRGNVNIFRLGQRLLVKVTGVDWSSRRVQFSLSEIL